MECFSIYKGAIQSSDFSFFLSNDCNKVGFNSNEEVFAYRALERMYTIYLKLTTKTTLPEIYDSIESKIDEMCVLFNAFRMEVINTFENECKKSNTLCIKDDYECFKNMIYKIKGNKDSKIEPMNKEIDFIISEIFCNYDNFKNDTKKYQKYISSLITNNDKDFVFLMLSYLLSIIEKNITSKISSIYSNSKIQQFKEHYISFQKKSKFILPERLFINDVCNKKKLDINNFIEKYSDSLNEVLIEISAMFEMIRKISETISIIFQGIFEKMRNGIIEVKDFKENEIILEINSLLSSLDLKMYVIDSLNRKISEDSFLKYCLICLKNSNFKTLSIEAFTYENYGCSDLMKSHSKFFINCIILHGMNQEYFPKPNQSFIEYFNKKNFAPIIDEIEKIKRETWKYINYNLKSIIKSINDQEGELDNKTESSKKIKRNSQISYVSNDDTTLSYTETNNYSDIDSLVNFINEKPHNKRKFCKNKDEIQKRYNRIYSETSTSDMSKAKIFIENGSENSNLNVEITKKNDIKRIFNDGKTCKISSFKSMKINHLSNIDMSVKEEKEEFSDNENYFKLSDTKKLKFLDSTKSINEHEEYFNIAKKINLYFNAEKQEKQIVVIDAYDDDKFVEEFKKNLKKDSIHRNYKWKITLDDEQEISL